MPPGDASRPRAPSNSMTSTCSHAAVIGTRSTFLFSPNSRTGGAPQPNMENYTATRVIPSAREGPAVPHAYHCSAVEVSRVENGATRYDQVVFAAHLLPLQAEVLSQCHLDHSHSNHMGYSSGGVCPVEAINVLIGCVCFVNSEMSWMSRCDTQYDLLLDIVFQRCGQACCYRAKKVAVNQPWPKKAVVISHAHQRAKVAGHSTES